MSTLEAAALAVVLVVTAGAVAFIWLKWGQDKAPWLKTVLTAAVGLLGAVFAAVVLDRRKKPQDPRTFVRRNAAERARRLDAEFAAAQANHAEAAAVDTDPLPEDDSAARDEAAARWKL